MTKRTWVKDSRGMWSSFDPVIQRQIERKAAKEAAERAEAMKDTTGFAGIGVEEIHGTKTMQATGDI